MSHSNVTSRAGWALFWALMGMIGGVLAVRLWQRWQLRAAMRDPLVQSAREIVEKVR